MSPKVAILILNWNGLKWLEDCLSSIFNLGYSNFDVVMIDNASSDNSVKYVRENHPKVKIIQNSDNLGYSVGFNVGLSYSMKKGYDYSLVMNNDTEIDKNALSELVKVAEGDNEIGFATGKVYYFYQPNTLQTVGRESCNRRLAGNLIGDGEVDRGQYDNFRDYDFVDDIFLLVRNEVLVKVGGYDPDFFLQFEETDWCIRVRNAGYRIVYTPFAKLWHKESLSSGGSYNANYSFFHPKNSILFMKKNGTNKQFANFLFRQLFFETPKIFMNHIIRNKIEFVLLQIRGLLSGYKWCLSRAGKLRHDSMMMGADLK